jgi:gliding motility-associated lipoprotein GldH
VKQLAVFSVLTALLMGSCTGDAVFSTNTSFSDGWSVTDTVQVTLPQLDSAAAYNLFINVRNTNDYPFNNLFLIAIMEFPQGKVITDTLEYRMANPDGTWMGSGLGSVKENKLWYKQGVRFTEQGEYKLSIVHAVRNNGVVDGVERLTGITDVGISAELPQTD